MLQFKKFPEIPDSTLEEARESLPHPEEPRFRLLSERRDPFPAWSGKNSRRSRRISRGGALHRKGERNSRVVPHSQSPPDVSVHSRETCFPSTASTLKPRIDSHHGGTWDSPVESLVGKPRRKASWDSPVGKPRGKASRESQRSLDPREGKRETAATTWKESARACPYSGRGLTPLWRLQKYPKIHVSTGEESSGSAPDPHKVLGPGIDGRGIPRGPRATRKGTGLS